MRLIKQIFKLLGVLVLVAGVGTLYVLNRGGAFRKLEPHFAGNCESLPLDASAEDMQVDRERGFVYISHLDRQALIKGEGKAPGSVQGTIMRIDLNRSPLAIEDALVDKPAHLRTHGLSLYIDPAGKRSLFVINHPLNRGTEPELVEVFDEIEPGRFRHRETFASPLFNSPNDMVAVGPRQFYVANDKVLRGALAAGLQQLGIGASPLTYFDGTTARVVRDDIASGGGINASADGTTLYVSETSAQRLRVLTRNPADGSVTETARIALPTSPDNIDVAADGSLWVTGHANTLKLIQHFIKGSPAPTQVLRVVPGTGNAATIDEIYVNAGEQIS
ncbi:MAG: SMP-30/gluconolactonase/LRE family protein, partial [Gammaproteobacteria bacterium]